VTSLTLDRLSKTYPGAASPVIDGLSLTVPAGGLTALLGPSGSGKSTLLRMIAGIVEPDAGDIRLGDRSILGSPPDRRGVVMVFQNAPLFPHLTLAGNVGFGLRMRGLPAAEITPRVATMLDRVQLSGLGDRRPSELSGGQAQRGALARALILSPDLLLLDEPLSNLDAGLRDEMRGLIRSLQQDTKTTMLVVTHDQAEAVALADRVALMLNGQLAQEATPWEMYRHPASVEVARFFGGVNFLQGRADAAGFHCALGCLPLPVGSAHGPGTLTIRPEAIRLGQAPDSFPAQVLSTTFLGTQLKVTLRIGEATLQVLTAPDELPKLATGAKVFARLPAHALWVIPDGTWLRKAQPDQS
jgi:putative spermidine/putrescine transport system ATP-binding protein